MERFDNMQSSLHENIVNQLAQIYRQASIDSRKQIIEYNDGINIRNLLCLIEDFYNKLASNQNFNFNKTMLKDLN